MYRPVPGGYLSPRRGACIDKKVERMAKKLPIRVALDLETTGLHAEQDSILEVAAIKFQGETVLDTLETLVAPGRSIPYRVQRLTGITPQKLVGVPHFESIS